MPIQEVLTADRRTLRVPFPASTAVSIGDLLWWDNSAKVAKPANSRTDTGSKAGNQADFAPLFLGVAADQRLAGETAVTGSTSPTGPGDRLVVPDGVFDAACASATWEYGDLVGVDRDSSPLNTNQQLVKVSNPNLAIGQVIKREPAAVTKVRVYLNAYKYGWFAQAVNSLAVLSGVATTAGGYAVPALQMGAAALGLYWGSGAPTISAPKGSLYLRTDGSSTSTRLYVNTDGATTWTNVTTAA